MLEQLKGVNEGYELPPVTAEISLEKMRIYERWPEVKNIHCDFEPAQQMGLPTPVCRGVMFSSYIYEMLFNTFGQYWFKNSKLAINFLKPVWPGDKIIAKGRVVKKTEEASVTLLVVDVAVVKENGELAAVGTANVSIP